MNWQAKKKRKRPRLAEEDYDEGQQIQLMDPGIFELLAGNRVESNDNHIYFYTEVTRKSVMELIQTLRKLNNSLQAQALKYSVEPKIYLHINSDGGEVMAAMAAVDAIRNSVIPVVSIIDGCAASSATLMSVVASERRIGKHAHMLIHQLSSGVWGKMQDIEEEVQNLENFMKVIKDIYKENTNMSTRTLNDVLKHDVWWSPQKCVEMGLIDSIDE